MIISNSSYFISPSSGKIYQQIISHVLHPGSFVYVGLSEEITYLPISPFLPKPPPPPSPTLTSSLLTEDGFSLITEDNFYLILE